MRLQWPSNLKTKHLNNKETSGEYFCIKFAVRLMTIDGHWKTLRTSLIKCLQSIYIGLIVNSMLLKCLAETLISEWGVHHIIS